MINCMVVDDEPLARECIVEYIAKTEFLNLIGEATNPTQLLRFSEGYQVDLVFMDIQMPMMTGIEYLKHTAERPITILTTAYPNYALEGYELDVLDYLVKPITFPRFYKSVLKAKDFQNLKNRGSISSMAQDHNPYFFVKCDSVYEKINISEIEYIQAQQNYITFHTLERKYMTLMPLKRIWELLPSIGFIQVHKSYVVAIDKIQALQRSKVKLTESTIPLSRNFKDIVYQKVMS